MLFEKYHLFIIIIIAHLKPTTMKSNLAGRIRMIFTAIVIMATGSLYAQSIEQAAELFNEGRAMINEGNNKGAIGKMEAAIKMCEELGEEGDELRNQAISVMPNLYYNYAKSLFDANQIDESIKMYRKTLEIAQKYNDLEVFTMTNNVLAQLFLKNGNDKFRDKDYEGAVADLKQSLEFDPKNTTALLLMAYSYRRLENTDEMISYFKATIDAGEQNDRNAPKAAEALMGHYMNTGARLLNARNSADGLKYLDTAATYGESGDLFYYYAVGYNIEQKYDQAIEAAEKAITLDPNNKENVARYNFEIGSAYYGKKDNARACEAYKKANFGRTALRAEPMIKSLNCK
jgi:tetratricopeptide (TPR) repeat protein